MKNKYYSFKDSYIFDDKGIRCYFTEGSTNLYRQHFIHGNMPTRTVQVDIVEGKIYTVNVYFENSNVKVVEVINELGTLNDLKEVSEKEAKKILMEDKNTISYALSNKPKKQKNTNYDLSYIFGGTSTESLIQNLETLLSLKKY